MTRNQFAGAAKVSRQAVAGALRRGWLTLEEDGRTIDRERRENREYLARYAEGFDVHLRPMATHQGPQQDPWYHRPPGSASRPPRTWKEWEKARQRELGAAEDEELTRAFVGSYGERPVEVRVADFILAGLAGANEHATRILAAFLAGLPRELEAFRRDLDEILADRENSTGGGAGARSRSAG